MNVFEELSEWLYPWQKQWIADRSKWKAAVKSRQIGFTTGCAALEALMHAFEVDGHQCFMVSTKVGNARRQMLKPMKQTFLPLLELDDDVGEFFREAKINKNKIILPNDSVIIAEANDSSTLRGNNESSYWFDEIAFWSERILETLHDSIWPQIDSPNNPNAWLRAFSTPWTHNLFRDIIYNKDGLFSQFSIHSWNIYEAVEAADDFNINPEELKKRYPKQKFEREYTCSFIRVGETYFDRSELIGLEVEGKDLNGWTCHLGVDLAQINDYSSVVPIYSKGGKYHVPKVWMMKSVKYNDQAAVVDDIIEQLEPESVCVDITAHQSFPSKLDSNIEGKMGNRERKVRHTEAVKDLAEEEQITFDWTTLLRDDTMSGFTKEPTKALLDDLSKVKQEKTASGKPKYEAPRDEDGHADSYSALLLALEAKEGGAKYCFG